MHKSSRGSKYMLTHLREAS